MREGRDMEKKSKKSSKMSGKDFARIELRLDPKLKDALKQYCDENYQTMSETIKSAIRRYIGYEQ